MLAGKQGKLNEGATASSLTQVYLIIWCLHLLQPWVDFHWLGTGSTGALDTRPLVPADATYLLPAVVMTLLLLIGVALAYSIFAFFLYMWGLKRYESGNLIITRM